MLPPRMFSALPVLVAALALDVAFARRQEPLLQPLGEVLHSVFDTDKDHQVTLDEIKIGLPELEKHLANSEGADRDDYKRWFDGVTEAAPALFDLLDADGDGTLSFAELEYATRFERSLLGGGGMAGFVKAVFGVLDSDGDDRLSVDELLAGSADDAVTAGVAAALHDLFPLRAAPRELERFVRGAVAALGITAMAREDREASNHAGVAGMSREDMVEYIAWLDSDDDGYVQRQEVGKRYNIAGQQFLAAAKAIRTVGPLIVMRAQFGGIASNVKNMGFGEL